MSFGVVRTRLHGPHESRHCRLIHITRPGIYSSIPAELVGVFAAMLWISVGTRLLKFCVISSKSTFYLAA